MSSFFCGERAAEEDIREAGEALRIPRDEAARAPPGRARVQQALLREAAGAFPGPGRAGGLLGREDDYVIPWDCITRLGDDIILVELPESPARKKRDKRPLIY